MDPLEGETGLYQLCGTVPAESSGVITSRRAKWFRHTNFGVKGRGVFREGDKRKGAGGPHPRRLRPLAWPAPKFHSFSEGTPVR
jgi:hypothetical protein